jgi:hypothetical protein
MTPTPQSGTDFAGVAAVDRREFLRAGAAATAALPLAGLSPPKAITDLSAPVHREPVRHAPTGEARATSSQVQPGTVLRDSYTGHIDFSDYSREATLLLPSEQALDVELRLHGLPNAIVLTELPTAVDDVRVYLNGTDITAGVRSVATRHLSGLGASELKAQYLNGVRGRARLLGRIAPIAQHADLVSQAESYAAAWSMPALLSSLGTRSVGWRGNAHVFNYLYDAIVLPPISLREAWKYQSGIDGSEPDLANITLTISHGPAASLTDAPISGVPPLGRVAYTVTVVRRDPIGPVLREVAGRVRALAQQVDTIRTTYLNPLTAEFETLRGEVTISTAGLREALNRLKATVDQIG